MISHQQCPTFVHSLVVCSSNCIMLNIMASQSLLI